MRALFLAAAISALALGDARAAPAIASGAYENTLLLGVDPATGAVSGYFDMTQGGQPSFSCIFYLKGRVSTGSASVDTYFPDDPKSDRIRGTLSAQGAGKVRLVLPNDHGGCGNVWQFADPGEPADFAMQTPRPWTSVRVVKAAKAYFYPSPSGPLTRSASESRRSAVAGQECRCLGARLGRGLSRGAAWPGLGDGWWRRPPY